MTVQMSLSEASKWSGKSVSSIRRWAISGLFSAEKDDHGCWIIDSNALQEYLSKTSSKRGHGSPKNEASSSESLHGGLLNALRREQDLNDELRKKLDEKDKEISNLLHEMKAILKEKYGGNLLSKWLRV